MPILKTIQTTTTQLYDTNGVAGFGRVVITPNKAFEYDDGVSTISVSNSSTVATVENGLLTSSFTLQPNTGASNSPDKTWYEVILELNGTVQRIFWQIASGDPSSMEFVDVPELPAVNDSDAISDHTAETNPHPQYVLRSDGSETKQASAASDGLGYFVRTNTSGIIDADMITDVTNVPAASIAITDAGGYYTGTDVEAALQEVGPQKNAVLDVQGSGIVYANTTTNYTLTGSMADITAMSVTIPSTGIWLVQFATDLRLSPVSAGDDVTAVFQLAGTSTFSTDQTWNYGVEDLQDTDVRHNTFSAIVDVTVSGTLKVQGQETSTGTGDAQVENSMLICTRIGDT